MDEHSLAVTSALPFTERGSWTYPRCGLVSAWRIALPSAITEELRARVVRATELTHKAQCPKKE